MATLLGACSGPGFLERGDSGPGRPVDLSRIPDAVPRVEPLSRSGNRSYVVHGRRYHVLASAHGYVARGIASWYGTKFHGRRTSNGERYDMYAMTAAHRTLPLPSYVRVTNLRNGRSVVVRVNDRGPFHDNRLIDLSYAAAAKLGMLGKGTAPVEVRALDPRAPRPAEKTRTARLPSALGPELREGRRASAPATHPSAKGAVPGLYLQVGSFGSRLNAEQLRRRLEKHLPLRIRILPGAAGGRRLFKVQVGPLPSVRKANSVGEALARLGIHDVRLVMD